MVFLVTPFFLGLWNWTNLPVLCYFLSLKLWVQVSASYFCSFSDRNGVGFAVFRCLLEDGISNNTATYLCSIAKAVQMEYDLYRDIHETRITNVTGEGLGKAS